MLNDAKEAGAGREHDVTIDDSVHITHVQLIPDDGGYQIGCTFLRPGTSASDPIWRGAQRRTAKDFQTLDDDLVTHSWRREGSGDAYPHTQAAVRQSKGLGLAQL